MIAPVASDSVVKISDVIKAYDTVHRAENHRKRENKTLSTVGSKT